MDRLLGLPNGTALIYNLVLGPRQGNTIYRREGPTTTWGVFRSGCSAIQRLLREQGDPWLPASVGGIGYLPSPSL